MYDLKMANKPQQHCSRLSSVQHMHFQHIMNIALEDTLSHLTKQCHTLTHTAEHVWIEIGQKLCSCQQLYILEFGYVGCTSSHALSQMTAYGRT